MITKNSHYLQLSELRLNSLFVQNREICLSGILFIIKTNRTFMLKTGVDFFYIFSATHPNKSTGFSVDLSYQAMKVTDKKLYEKVVDLNLCPRNITSASFAGNSLFEAPFYTLSLISHKLTYLSLKNNNFAPTVYIILNKKIGKCVLMSVLNCRVT